MEINSYWGDYVSVFLGSVSYLPDNKLRDIRFKSACTQFEWLHSLFPDLKVNVVAQGYKDEECLYDFVNYIRYPNGIGAANARNVLLSMFYKTEDDWILLCDDDTIIDDKYSYENFVYEITSNNTKFRDLDAVSAVEPEYYPYKKLNYADKFNRTHYKFKPRELNSGSATSFMRNIKKYYDDELYFPDIDANKGEGREDIEFLISWLKRGYNWYTMSTLIRKSLCFNKSSIFGDNVETRDKILKLDLDMICLKYANDGITRGNDGRITWKKFNTQYNTSKNILYIEREKEIEFGEKEKPKPDKNSSRRLF